MMYNLVLLVITWYTFQEVAPSKAETLLANMTLQEKVGQLVQVERGDLEPGDIKTYFLGSVLSGGGSIPDAAPGQSVPDSWITLLNSYLAETSDTRLKIPIIYGMDAVHGVNNVVGATVFPHNINYGATAVGCEALGIANVEEQGKAVQEEVHALGVPWTFAPVLGNPQNIHWGRTYEGFSENISIPALLGPVFIEAVQSTGQVSACMKHYIGEGYTTDGKNRGDAILTREEVRGLLAPYAASVKAGAWTLMPSFSAINGLRSTENKFILQTLLKDELGFDGFTVSDWDAVSMLPGNRTYKQKIAASINAGLDMIMAATDGDDPDFDEENDDYGLWAKQHWKDTYNLILENVNDGNISLSRLDDAVLRILRIKERLGLLNETIVYTAGVIGTHHDLARKHAAESLVLLKNKNIILNKLGSFTNFLVAGQGADDIGMQCGGWTKSWQGDHGDIVPGTSILNGLKAVSGKNFTYSENGTTNGTFDAVIVVVGEDPYAEWYGDRTGNITLRENDLVTLQNAYSLKIPTIVILLSGRPLHLGTEVDNWDALIAAFLPGSEAGPGIADVLFGAKDFVAKLPYTWTKYCEGPVVYPYGFGLTKSTGEIDPVTPENLLSLMTLEEKAGQLVQVERGDLLPGDIAKYTLGSVLSGGGSVPSVAPGQTVAESWITLLESYLAETSQTRLKIPIIYGMDAVHGVNNVVGSTVFPHNINYGATAVGNEAVGIANVQEEGKAVLEEVRALGVPWTFAPVLGNPQNIHWGRTYEGFSENITIPTLLGPEFIKAVQSTSKVSACMKHYIGEGYTTDGKNRGDAILTEAQVRGLLAPYAASVKAGAWTLMPSFSAINGTRCTENKFVLQTLLKDELGFDGFTVSDWDAVSMLPGNRTYKEKIAASINAGLDMIMAATDGDDTDFNDGVDDYSAWAKQHWKDTYNLIIENVKDGNITVSRLDDAVLRILRIKERLGLLQSDIVLKAGPIGTHHHLARKHAVDSFVLLKNKEEILNTIVSKQNFLVAGQGADDVGMQCGGWTESWQGGHGSIVPGTSILEGLRAIPGKSFVYSVNADNNFVQAAFDAAIVVVGEEPYAEWYGDRTGNITLSDSDLATLQNVYKLNIPTIVILLSGRPLHLGDEVDKWDALIAAFLPGSEAGPAIADVLFRGQNFVAKLPYTWPKSDGGAVAFPYGFGLTKATPVNPINPNNTDSEVIAELEGVKAELNNVKEALVNATGELKNTTGELEGVKGELVDVKGELVDVNKTLNTVDEELVSVKEDLGVAKESLSNFTTALVNVTSGLKDVTSGLKDVKDALAEEGNNSQNSSSGNNDDNKKNFTGVFTFLGIIVGLLAIGIIILIVVCGLSLRNKSGGYNPINN